MTLGDLVVRNSRWMTRSADVGVIVGQREAAHFNLHVMWTVLGGTVLFSWHSPPGLLVIDSENLVKIQQRCSHSTT